jgi:hypothetical protein
MSVEMDRKNSKKLLSGGRRPENVMSSPRQRERRYVLCLGSEANTDYIRLGIPALIGS